MFVINKTAQDAQGNAITGANCFVYARGTTTIVPITDALGASKSNPFLSAPGGLIQFSAEPGEYDLRVTSGSLDSTIPVSIIGSAGLTDSGIDPDETPTNSDLGSAAFTDYSDYATAEQGLLADNAVSRDLALLNAISENKALTGIVDICVYNTALDTGSDAWRYNRRASWYNEPLNTATRGSRKEFPTVAVIVAQTGKVTIYDGDDPSLPMWMVFNRGGSFTSWTNNTLYFLTDSITISSVTAAEGVIVIGSINKGVLRADFGIDVGLMQNGTALKRYGAGLGSANNGAGWTQDDPTLQQLVSVAVNDVAVTILPNAPVDPLTGLQIPTIAVATDGNGTYLISVITNGGDVYDIGADGGFTCVSVSIGSDYSLTAVRSDGTVFIWNDIGLIDSDGYAPDETISSSATSTLGTVNIVEAA